MLCTERSCGNPGAPDNGEKNSSSYQYGNVISFTCNVGYTMQGSQVRTCQTNGEWTGTQPTCPSKLEHFCVRQGFYFVEDTVKIRYYEQQVELGGSSGGFRFSGKRVSRNEGGVHVQPVRIRSKIVFRLELHF